MQLPMPLLCGGQSWQGDARWDCRYRTVEECVPK
jgi:hypothetical protein